MAHSDQNFSTESLQKDLDKRFPGDEYYILGNSPYHVDTEIVKRIIKAGMIKTYKLARFDKNYDAYLAMKNRWWHPEKNPADDAFMKKEPATESSRAFLLTFITQLIDAKANMSPIKLYIERLKSAQQIGNMFNIYLHEEINQARKLCDGVSVKIDLDSKIKQAQELRKKYK